MILCSLFIILSAINVSFGLKEEEFFSGVLCDLDEKISFGCSILKSTGSTLNKCVLECSLDTECIGASVDDNRNCYHHSLCVDLPVCSVKEQRHRYKSKNCAHGGVWNPTSSSCRCVDGWIGSKCLDLPSECHQLYTHGYRASQRCHLLITVMYEHYASVHSSPLLCFVSSAGSTIEVLNNAGDIDFNRTWEEYKKGFYLDERNNWIGLDNWHAVSNVGYTNLVVTTSIRSTYRRYNYFHVSNEYERFPFTFASTYEEILDDPLNTDYFGDCFGHLQNMPFYTKDKGDDIPGGHIENCAKSIGSGWWYETGESCGSVNCNLLGKAPRDWDNIAVYQRMNVEGFNPEMIMFSDGVYFRLYVEKEMVI